MLFCAVAAKFELVEVTRMSLLMVVLVQEVPATQLLWHVDTSV